MSQLQDNVKVQFSGLVLAIQDGVFKFKQWFGSLPKWERTTFIVLVILLIPGLIAVRYGSELYFTKSYNQLALSAQPSTSNPDPLVLGSAKVIQNPNNTVSAYAEVTNTNLDLSIEALNYTFHFFNANNEEVTSTNGSTYLLPDQKKWLVVSKVQSLQSITSAKVEITDQKPNWQKRIDLPQVTLKMSEPSVYEELNPLATSAEGSVVNNSPYNLNQVTMLFVLYDKNNQVIAVTTREEYTVKAYERRAYKLQWPSIYRADVAKIDLQAYTNTLDPKNISASTPVK